MLTFLAVERLAVHGFHAAVDSAHVLLRLAPIEPRGCAWVDLRCAHSLKRTLRSHHMRACWQSSHSHRSETACQQVDELALQAIGAPTFVAVAVRARRVVAVSVETSVLAAVDRVLLGLGLASRHSADHV